MQGSSGNRIVINVMVNGTALLAPLTGIGHYIRHLFGEMSGSQDVSVRVHYGLHCANALPPVQEGGHPVASEHPSPATARQIQRAYAVVKKLVPYPRELRRFAEKISFNYHAARVPGTIYHEPNFIPLPYRGPTVITVHDLSCFDHPETHPRDRVEVMQRELPSAIARADHIITISKATADAVQKWFGVSRDRLTVTHLAADQRFRPRPAEQLREPLASLSLQPGGYLLCVGTLEPRKNLGVLFDAYAKLPDVLRTRYPLAISGMTGWHIESLFRQADSLIQRGQIRLLGYVPDALIPSLYAGAAAFAYPSIYEGFGLPPLEAMSSGVPVITSNRTSLPEVVGSGGLMVDAMDVDGFSDGLKMLLGNKDQAALWGQRGQAQAARFSWHRCAQETVAVYRQVAQRSGIAD